MNGNTKYHAELKLTIEGREARINVFADTLNEIFVDFGTICSQFQPEWKNPARSETMNLENAARRQPVAATVGKPVNASSQPKSKAAPRPGFDEYYDEEEEDFETGEVPVCKGCGTDENMELITFADKKTGEPRQAWKCQVCNKWHWNGNGRGR